MRWAKYGYIGGAVLSVAVHVFAFGGLSAIKKSSLGRQNVAVMMSSAKKKQKPKPPEPPKPIEAPKEMLQHPLAPPRAAPPVAPPPPDPIAAAHPALAAMPYFGFILSGNVLGGPGGIAVPMGGPAQASAEPAVHKEKTFGSTAERPAAAADDCQEDLVKAKPQALIQAAYSDDARAAGIEGRVRVQITIDASGAVVDAKLVSGLGHGLDEAALAAAKRMSFSPATRCGKAVQSTFMYTTRFALGE